MYKLNTSLFDTLRDMFYPVGSIYMSASSTNPSEFMGGTWEEWGSGRVPVGVNTNDTNFSTVEKTGGASTVALSVAQMPAHNHGSVSLIGCVWNLIGQDSGTGITVNGIISKSGDSTAYYPSSKKSTSSYKDGFCMNASHTHTTQGSGSAHNNLQPYITCYMFKRTA